MDLAEIDERVNSLGKIEGLTTEQALSTAYEIVKTINDVVEVQVEEENYATVGKLYKRAAAAYLTAAEKVPRESRDRVAFPANYWSMRAVQAELMARKPSASRFEEVHL
jgi:hypothetical protein